MNCQCHFLQLTYMTKCDDVNLMFLKTFSTWNKWQNLFPTDHNYSEETGIQNLGFEFFPIFYRYFKVQKPISVGLYFPPKNPRIGNSCWDLQYNISHRPLSSTLEITCKLLLGKWYYPLLLYILHKFTLTTIRK